MTFTAIALIAGGIPLASRQLCHASRALGVAMLSAAMLGAGLLIASPVLAADETLLAADNGEVACTVAANGLTRVSLKDDRLASVSKLTTGVETEDFTVVNEPTRGDIYISVPEGYTRPTVSFFGTTAKGFTYKFACRTGGPGTEIGDAHQVFVHNRDIMAAEPAEVARRSSPQNTSVALVQAMYANASLEGFEVRQPLLPAVYVGGLKVQMISEYRGLEVAGRVLRIENKSRREVALDERTVAPSNALAVSVAQPTLKPGESTTAYIVLQMGAAQ